MADFHELLVRYKTLLEEFKNEDLPHQEHQRLYEELKTTGKAIEILAGIG